MTNEPFFRVDGYQPRTVPGRIEAIGFILQSKIPLADVCKEPRRIMEERFTNVFTTSAVFLIVWFNFKIDILYLDLATMP